MQGKTTFNQHGGPYMSWARPYFLAPSHNLARVGKAAFCLPYIVVWKLSIIFYQCLCVLHSAGLTMQPHEMTELTSQSVIAKKIGLFLFCKLISVISIHSAISLKVIYCHVCSGKILGPLGWDGGHQWQKKRRRRGRSTAPFIILELWDQHSLYDQPGPLVLSTWLTTDQSIHS